MIGYRRLPNGLSRFREVWLNGCYWLDMELLTGKHYVVKVQGTGFKGLS